MAWLFFFFKGHFPIFRTWSWVIIDMFLCNETNISGGLYTTLVWINLLFAISDIAKDYRLYFMKSLVGDYHWLEKRLKR